MVPETNLNMLDQHWAPGPLKIALPQDMHFQYSLRTSALRLFLTDFSFPLLDYVFVTYHPKLSAIPSHIHTTAASIPISIPISGPVSTLF